MSHDGPYPVNDPRNHSWADCNWRPPQCQSLHFRSNIANIPDRSRANLKDAILSTLFVLPEERGSYCRTLSAMRVCSTSSCTSSSWWCPAWSWSRPREKNGVHQIINQSSSADTHSGGGVRATSPHVEVDVVAGVVAAQMSCLVPEVLSYGNFSLSARYLVVLPAEWVRVT